MKRLIALLLCLATLICVFAGCGNKENEEEDLGAYIEMYITDEVYNFDPAYAYGNESALKIISLLYENLFVLSENGKVEESLVKKYKIDKKKNQMTITLREDVLWSDGIAVTSSDVVFAWERLLDPSKSFEAASLLYDVKNAKEAKEGNVASIDDVGIEPLNNEEILITFVENADYDRFLHNLTSYALAPVRKSALQSVANEDDWAKSREIIVTSGPFTVESVSYAEEDKGITLERNKYYHRDVDDDKIDKAVKPHRLHIDYTMSDEEIFNAYNEGKLFFIGDIPLSIRGKYSDKEWKKQAEVKDAMSTHSYVFNTEALISTYNPLTDSTTPIGAINLFSNANVRKALSLAIDRTAIAAAVVFADPATGLLPNGVFEADSRKDTFRENSSNSLAVTPNLAEADALLTSAGFAPGSRNYSFAISVPAYDDVHMAIAKMVQQSWNALGFHVTINAIDTVENTDPTAGTGGGQKIPKIVDDIFTENYHAGNFEVAAIDFCADTPDAFSLLSRFALEYSGRSTFSSLTNDFTTAPHVSGYNSAAYNGYIAQAKSETDPDARAEILHQAEDLLMTELPIVPIIFNKSATMVSKDLKNVDFDYNMCPIFTKAKLKNYEDYLPAKETEAPTAEAPKKDDSSDTAAA